MLLVRFLSPFLLFLFFLDLLLFSGVPWPGFNGTLDFDMDTSVILLKF